MELKFIEFIKKLAENRATNLDYNRNENTEKQKDLIRQSEKVLLGEAPLTDALIGAIRPGMYYDANQLFVDILGQRAYGWDESFSYPWTTDHPLVQKLIRYENVRREDDRDNINTVINVYIALHLSEAGDTTPDPFVSFLHAQKFPDEYIAEVGSMYSSNTFYTAGYRKRTYEPQPEKITKFGVYLLSLLQTKGEKSDSIKSIVDGVVFSYGNHSDKKKSWLKFLYDHQPARLEGQYSKFLWEKDYNNVKKLDLPVVLFLLEKDAVKFESLALDALKEVNASDAIRFSVLTKLDEKIPNKYEADIVEIGEAHFEYFKSETDESHYSHDPYINSFGRSLSMAYSEYLWRKDEGKARVRITQFIQESKFLTPQYLRYLDEKMQEQALPLLIEALFKDPGRLPTDARDYYVAAFAIFDKHDITPYLGKIIEFCVTLADKRTRVIASKTLARYDEAIFAEATNLVKGKTVDQRVTGTLILSAIGTEKVESILNEAVDSETNDDTRDIMLETLQEKRFAKPYSLEQVKEMIAKADARKKLSKWSEKFLDEEKLPAVYWKGSSTPLDQKDVRFLFYRMKRAQGLNSDIEAKQLINQLDSEKSQAFAKALLIGFEESGADSKLKYYLTLAGLLGDDDMMHRLNMLFKKSIADKRVKMAEYVIGALAMVGSDKALRIVEVIYRKFANKKPAISKAAQEALTAAATELSITTDELADKIIPNFDFDGLYKKFTVDGEEYRAFISADFKLNYFTEDNKIRKSLPSNVSKELKTEFKNIEKELNDVIKSQRGRLEKYLVEERRWPVENWRTFFFENPIMFVYALKLVWGVYDEQGNLLNSFYCSEDTSLYNVADEEVTLEDGQYVGILHPLHLAEADLNAWRDKLYAMSMVTIFPILERPVFRVDDKEKDQSSTKKFFGQEVPKGADFVNTLLVKQNWIKTSGDGGRSEFNKHFRDGAFKAYAHIDGPAAYYQGGNTPAKVFEISFMKKNWQDKVSLKDIPAVFYSEVISDIDQLIKAT